MVPVGVPGGWLSKYAPISSPVEGPAVFGIGGRVNAHESVAGPDKCLERSLLVAVQDIAGGVQENHHSILREVGFRENSGILGGVHLEVVCLPHRLNGRDARGNGIVPEACGFGKDQGLETHLRGNGCRRRGGGHSQQAQNEYYVTNLHGIREKRGATVSLLPGS